MALRDSPHGYWSSPRSFVLAAGATTVGLGSVWRLPALMGENGGSAFLLVYIAAMLLVGLPVLVAELIVGRYGRSDMVGNIEILAQEGGVHRAWAVVGWLAMLGAALVLSYSAVIAGWSFGYIARAAGGVFSGATEPVVNSVLRNLVGDPERSLAWQTIFMVMVVVAVSHGLRKGLEPLLGRVLPFIVVLLLFVLLAGSIWGAPGRALEYLLGFRPEQLGWRGVVEALHQAFFTLSLGMGVMVAFGVSLPSRTWLVSVGAGIMAIDLVIGMIAGIGVYSLILGAGFAPESGVRMVFITLPMAGGRLEHGSEILMLFYFALGLVALCSTIGMMESVTQWVMSRWGISRVFAATSAGTIAWLAGSGTLLSFFDVTAQITFFGRTFFEWLDLLTARFLLPASGLLLCIFIGRILPLRLVREAWAGEPSWAFSLWRWCLTYPARIGLIVVLLQATGLLGWLVDFFTTRALTPAP